MKQNSEYCAMARFALRGHWNEAALFTFVYGLIVYAVNAAFTLPFGNNLLPSTTGSIVGTLIVLPIVWGFCVAFIRLMRGQGLQMGWLFEGYSKKSVFVTMLLKYVYITLWSMLLIIPGVVKSYSYAMTEFILEDNPELTENKAIEESMRIMQGKKLDLFLLDLSFIGWILLSALTFFVGMLWVAPYMNAARAAFYEDLKAEYYAQ